MVSLKFMPTTAISIHAPARGATRHAIPNPYNMGFQSTLPRGERRRRSQKERYPEQISIHAPARGATYKLADLVLNILISIHAPARGATNICSAIDQLSHFNPRSREGSDNSDTIYHRAPFDFNPRSREGSDRKYTQTTNIISVYFYLYYIIFVSLATNTAYITITKPSKCRCESPYTFC